MEGKSTMTVEEYQELMRKAKGSRANKYGNRWVIVDGIKFQSQHEANRYGILKLLERQKEIFNLRRQVRYELNVPQGKICSYYADFVYENLQGVTVVEDAKSAHTRKLRPYIMKRRMMKLLLGITIKEV